VFIATQRVRVNRDIRVPEVRVIDSDGEQLGVLDTQEALKLAQSKQLDLVEVAPGAKPPVCKILDFNKYKYQMKKREKKQKRSELKELRFTTQIQENDLNTKVRHMKKFLESGDKVRVTVIFRGREIVHRNRGQELIDHIMESIGDIAKIDENAKSRGRALQVILVPIKAGE
jgi:translation initiation factor IF-3